MMRKKGGHYYVTKSVTWYGWCSDAFCHFGMVCIVTDFVTSLTRGSEACAVWRMGARVGACVTRVACLRAFRRVQIV